MENPIQTQASGTTQGPDIFDQMAQQPQPPQPSQSQSQLAQPQGDIFDQVAAQTNSPTQQHYADNQYLDINEDDNPAMKGLKGLNAIGAGIGDGFLETLNGGANLLHIPHQTLTDRQKELEEQNAGNPLLHGIGHGAETISEFLLGDEALKGLSLAKRLGIAAKVAETLENSPRVLQALQIGARVMRSAAEAGGIGGAQSLVRSGTVDADTLSQAGDEAMKDAAYGGIFGAGSEALSSGVKAIRSATDTTAVSKALNGELRRILDSVADKSGVAKPTATSLRDAVAEVGTSIKNEGTKIYRAIDKAIGGTRFQTFDEQISNVRRALRDSAGISPDEDGRLIERLNDLEDAKQKALDEAIANGVDPDLIHQANANWRQGSALEDLQKHIRESASGLRPELQSGLRNGQTAAPEAISPAKLAPRANRLYSTGRLAQALSSDHADDLLRAVEAAAQREKQVAANRKVVGTVLKGAAGVAGIGGASGVVHHLLQ